MDWVFVSSTAVNNAAHFSQLRKYPNSWELDECTPLHGKVPADAEIQMQKDFPNDIELVDSLYVGGSVLFINHRVCELLTAQGVSNVEFLPIRVINHKGKPTKEDYFMLNILTRVDCIDLEASTVTWNEIDPQMIGGVKKLVLDSDRLPRDVKVFRPQRMQYKMLIHRSVVREIQSQGLRGFIFKEISEFKYP